MENNYFVTITGTKHYYGMKPFEIGRIIKLVKEPHNEYDPEVNDVIKIIHDLKGLGLIKQDGGSVAAGVNWDDKEAIYNTVLEKRNVLDML